MFRSDKAGPGQEMEGGKNDRREREEGEPVKSELPHPDNKREWSTNKNEENETTDDDRKQTGANSWQ